MIKNIIFLPGWGFKPGIWQRQEAYFANLGFNVILSGLEEIEGNIKKVDLGETIFIAWSLGWFKLWDILKDKEILPHAIVGVSAALDFPKPLVRLVINEFRKDPGQLWENFYSWLFSSQERKSLIFSASRDIISNNRVRDREILLKYLLFLRDINLSPFMDKVNIPILLIAGEGDVICPLKETMRLSKFLGGSNLKRIDTGHISFLAKAEEFNQVIIKFISNLNDLKFKVSLSKSKYVKMNLDGL